MENEKERVIEKIKKLLRMQNGGTAAEIETALRLAYQMAKNNNIDINSIDVNAVENKITEEFISLLQLRAEHKYALFVCKHFFNVDFIISKGNGVHFIGTSSDIAIAKYIHGFLYRHFTNSWRARNKKLKNRAAFIEGMYLGICYMLNKEKKQIAEGAGIVLSTNRISDYIKKRFCNMLTEIDIRSKNQAHASHRAGIVAGLNTKLNKGVGVAECQKKLTE